MLILVPTPIGNIADISLRAMDALAEADVLLCEDTRVTKKLLHILKERYNLKTKEQNFISLHSHNEQDFIEKTRLDLFLNQMLSTFPTPGCPVSVIRGNC